MRSLVRGVRGEPLSRHTSWHIGGPADYFLSVGTTDDLIEGVLAAREQALPVFILGGGTNLLVADAGIRGVVIHNQVDDTSVDGTRISATAGVTMAHVAAVAGRNGIGGLEFAATVPGTVGGAVHGNAGAFGTETKDVVEEVALFDPATGVSIVEPRELAFRYRYSALKERPEVVVLQAAFRGVPSERGAVVAKIKEMANLRMQKQPLRLPNSGSVFKNPPGDHAGRLVEAAGLKGLRVGGAVVSEKHGNFIVNDAEATAADVRALIEEVQRRVFETVGVRLEPEVEFVGEWS
ncbi:MAG: UDP-N-acetylmuramate dehydrogenase [Chloroflexi bacterium]|nr:MAG: UDP-N-acetylmuramate dehydrogenase [Chloroflexota bacterium]